jgi:hypothetical protein
MKLVEGALHLLQEEVWNMGAEYCKGTIATQKKSYAEQDKMGRQTPQESISIIKTFSPLTNYEHMLIIRSISREGVSNGKAEKL